MAGKMVLVKLTTGMEDERSRSPSSSRCAALGRGSQVAMFLTQEAVRLAEPGTAEGTFCEGCPPLDRLFAQFAEGGGELLACPFCVDSRGLDAEGFVAEHARVAGATPMFEWLGDEPGQIFSY